jgi:hypothetical protein
LPISARFPLSEFVTGRRTAGLAADLQTMVLARRLEDNAHILLPFDDHADILVARQGGAEPTRWCCERRWPRMVSAAWRSLKRRSPRTPTAAAGRFGFPVENGQQRKSEKLFSELPEE